MNPNFTEINLWKNLLDSIDDPIPDQISQAAKYLASGAIEMYQSQQHLNQLSPEQLRAAINNAYFNKEAQLWEGAKYLGKKTLNVLPAVGFVFSFLQALKNFVYGLNLFAKLSQDSHQIGLTWFEILFPENLKKKIDEYSDQPVKLKTVASLSKYSKQFSDEGISFVVNIIDFIKDTIFIFIDIGTFGWLTVADVSLSVFLMGVEYLAEKDTLPLFDQTLQNIIELANFKIADLSKMNFSSMDKNQLYQWFLEH